MLVGKQSADKFGGAVSVVDALNTDQHKDLIIGAPKEGTGRVYVFLGPFDENCPVYLSAIYAHRMFASPDGDTFDFGDALNSLPDMDGDNFDEVLIRGSFIDAAGQPRFRSYIYSGHQGSLIDTIDGDATFQSGQMSMASSGESCYGDIAGTGGVPDGVVNVDDMLLVLNTYGPCPALPDPCPGDIAPRGNPMGNGVVDVDDLLGVINAWGPCPLPGVVYTSNGTGGGDWFDPNTWNPLGVPGTLQHFDVVRILPGDTVTQSANYVFTLGLYWLENGATHAFEGPSEIASLVVEAELDGRWLRAGDMEPIIMIRNARQVFRTRHAYVQRVYECATFCDLLKNPSYPFSTLVPCAEIPCEEIP